MNGLLLVWKAMKGSAKTLLAVGLVLSLAVNILMFTSSIFVTAASSFLSTTLGIKSVFARQADDLAELAVDIDHERRMNRQLQSEAAEVRGAADNILRRVTRRTGLSAARDLAAMPAEAIPYIGAAVIAGATFLEIRDMCENLKDLRELQRTIDPSSQPSSEEQTVCAIDVPSKQQLLAASSNAAEEAWLAARDAMPSIESLQTIELSINWEELASTTQSNAKDFLNGMMSRASEETEWLDNWWND